MDLLGQLAKHLSSSSAPLTLSRSHDPGLEGRQDRPRARSLCASPLLLPSATVLGRRSKGAADRRTGSSRADLVSEPEHADPARLAAPVEPFFLSHVRNADTLIVLSAQQHRSGASLSLSSSFAVADLARSRLSPSGRRPSLARALRLSLRDRDPDEELLLCTSLAARPYLFAAAYLLLALSSGPYRAKTTGIGAHKHAMPANSDVAPCTVKLWYIGRVKRGCGRMDRRARRRGQCGARRSRGAAASGGTHEDAADKSPGRHARSERASGVHFWRGSEESVSRGARSRGRSMTRIVEEEGDARYESIK